MFFKRRDRDDNLYKRLQDQSLQLVQQLSGEVWTDYNAHDPGVTILDQLNVALLDLDYQFSFSFREYLNTNRISDSTFGLLSPKILFSPSIVTTADYERLIINSISDVVDCTVNLDDASCYRIQIEAIEGCDQIELQKQIETLYHKHRNLCENLNQIEFQKLGRKDRKTRNDIEFDEHRVEPDYVERNKSPYYSIQNDFPNCYGINAWGLPSNATPQRRAQALQLKAYLLIFDYLIANSIQQSENITTLFELSKDIQNTDLPMIDLIDIEKLVDKDKLALNTTRDDDFWHLQRSLYLDTLDMLYGENTRSFFGADSQLDLPTINQKRSELINLLPQLNANRFRSFNLLDAKVTDTIPIKKLIGILLGCQEQNELSTINILQKYQLRLINDFVFFKHHRIFNLVYDVDDVEQFWINCEIEKIPILANRCDHQHFSLLRKVLRPFELGCFFECFLQYGENWNNYRIIHYEERGGYLFVFTHPDKNTWINLGFFENKDEAIRVANILFQFIQMLCKNNQSFYLLEHILLDNDFAQNRRLSIVLSEAIQSPYSHDECENLILERLPAHLDIHFYWLKANQMYHFERFYFAWKKAIAIKNREKTTEFGNKLKDFLTANTMTS